MNEEKKIYIPSDGPPQERPNQEIYAKMGEANIFLMLEDFYHELEKSEIRHLFPEDMVKASQKSAAFFVSLLGGPPLYQQKYGPPMMRQRHMPFTIDEKARQVWLSCFTIILVDAEKKYGFPLEQIDGFRRFLDRFSRWMVNTQ